MTLVHILREVEGIAQMYPEYSVRLLGTEPTSRERVKAVGCASDWQLEASGWPALNHMLR
jgi:hypothetical protein